MVFLKIKAITRIIPLIITFIGLVIFSPSSNLNSTKKSQHYIYNNQNLAKWIDPKLMLSNQPQSIQEIKSILKNNIQIKSTDSSLEKSIKIGRFVFSNLDNKRGNPSMEINDPTICG